MHDNFYSAQKAGRSGRCNDDVRWTWFGPTWLWFERMLITVLNVGDTVFMVVSNT